MGTIKKMRIECEHIETGAKGFIKDELVGTDRFPDQWGIFWTEKANHGNYASHYYWNDKTKIRIIKN